MDPDLAKGETVEVFVTKSSPMTQRSAIDILAEVPGHRIFETEDTVNDYLESERESWERQRCPTTTPSTSTPADSAYSIKH